jgi:uncharacterized 2Fe-2S/4Fe-4S cluster protein (DUF4445 family)
MKVHELTVEPLNRKVLVEDGQSVLEALRAARIRLAAECGGQGLCHKCRVLLLDGHVEPVDDALWWTEPEGDGQWVLACQARARSDLVIRLSPQALAGDMVVLSAIGAGKKQLEAAVGECYWPLAQYLDLALSQPTSDDSEPDLQRLARALADRDKRLPPVQAGIGILQTLPSVLRTHKFRVRATVGDFGDWREIIALGAIPSDEPLLGVAVDIGTSTVALQLVDLEHAQPLAAASGTNAQVAYGADVITRIIWCEEHDNGAATMQRTIVNQIGDLAATALAQAELSESRPMAVSISGNATMVTFALGADPRPIRREPHVPLARELPVLRAADLGFPFHPNAPVFFCPAVSGFVGGDITAGVLATGMAFSDELSLLVDVGTNGEIVLGNRDWLMCCSCSAGPAFEGVGIEGGVRAVPGAIESISYDAGADRFRWQTIANAPPIGLCGTGLLEALATMFRAGLLDRSGHLDVSCGSDRIREEEDEAQVVLVDAEDSATGRPIVMRESEIENLIRSKGAIYAGISSLLHSLSLEPEAIDRIYLAGAFGNRLRVEEAVTIGMLPDLPRERITFAGNTALAGAYLALLCRQARDVLGEIASRMTYLELSIAPKFMDEFVAALFLPHTDLSRFPSQAHSPANSS